MKAVLFVVLHASAVEVASLQKTIGEVVAYFPELTLSFRDPAPAKLELAIASDLDPPLINAEWFQRETLLEREISESAKARLPADVARLVRAMIERRGFTMHGRLAVTTIPPQATVTIEGAALSAGSSVLPPGTYHLVASSSGHADAERTIQIEAGETLHVELSLRERTIVESPWLWTLIAAVVVGSAVTAGVLLQPEPTFTICQRGTPGECR